MNSRSRGPLRVTVTDGRGRAVAAGTLTAWLSRVAPARAGGHVAVALVSDTVMRSLNRRYRGVDAVTDVLSFPIQGLSRSPQRGALPMLGDIVIARGRAARQARRLGHSLDTELRVLALHGLLHLAGYDHEHDRGRMARLEQRLRRAGGLREGLIERAAP